MSYVQKDILVPARPPRAAMHGLVDDAFNAFGNLVAGGTSAFLKLAAPRYAMVGGIAKPTDQATLDLFKELQRQLNRVASKKGIYTIAVDGDIGDGTKALAVKVQAAAAVDRNLWASAPSDTLKADIIDKLTTLAATKMSVESIAQNAIGIYANVKAYADQLAAPPSVPSPKPASPPAVYNLATGTAVPQAASASLVDGWRNLGTGAQLGIIGALGVAAVFMIPKKKKRKA